MIQTFTAIVHQEEKLYVAECSETGTASQGETIEEALANLQEATELYLDEFPVKSSSRWHFTMPDGITIKRRRRFWSAVA